MNNSIDSVIQHVENARVTTNQVFGPIRQSAFKRFPTIFGFLVTFGAATMFFGIERILGNIAWLNNRPFMILGIGICILALTGRLYKKLG